MEALLEQCPIIIQLFGGLVEVAAIGGQCCLIQSDDSCACGSRETGDELSSGIGRSYVFGLMAVLRWNNCQSQSAVCARAIMLLTVDIYLVPLHQVPQAGQTFGGGHLFHVDA